MNPGVEGCSEPRLCHCTLAWVTRTKFCLKKRKKKEERKEGRRKERKRKETSEEEKKKEKSKISQSSLVSLITRSLRIIYRLVK